jgi:hypothetical protein
MCIFTWRHLARGIPWLIQNVPGQDGRLISVSIPVERIHTTQHLHHASHNLVIAQSSPALACQVEHSRAKCSDMLDPNVQQVAFVMWAFMTAMPLVELKKSSLLLMLAQSMYC